MEKGASERITENGLDFNYKRLGKWVRSLEAPVYIKVWELEMKWRSVKCLAYNQLVEMCHS